jgi:hypothetical protein
MISAGEIRGVVRAGGGRRFGFVTPEAVGECLAASASTLTARETADLLGIGVRQLARLARAGMMPCAPPSLGSQRGRRYLADAVSRMRLALDAVARSGPPPEAAIALSDVSRSRQVCFTKAVQAAAAAQLGLWRVEPVGNRPLFADYRILVGEAADLRTATAKGQEPVACMSVKQVASRLELSMRMVPVLVAAGCLESAIFAREAGPLPKRGVTVKSVDAFHQRYATLAQVAAARGTSTRALLARLIASGVQPVVASDSARGISSVWRANEL